MVCLFALLAAAAPRVALVLLWIFTPYVTGVFDTWIFPLLGVIFLPFTTLMYVLVAAPLGSANIWGWLIVLLAFVIDIRGYFDAYTNRERIPGVA